MGNPVYGRIRMGGQVPEKVIRASKGFNGIGLGEVWAYRELLWYHTLKEIKAKYRQMALGPVWIILQPVITTLIFTFVFSSMAGMKSDGEMPYAVLVMSGQIPWLFFQQSCTFSTNSLVKAMPVISKIYFPRLIIPLSATLGWLVDFFASLVILAALMAWYGIVPDARIVFAPLYILFMILTTLAVGAWSAAVTVRFRDMAFVIQYGLRLFMFLTPVNYTAAKLLGEGSSIRATVMKLNPMYHVIEGFRWSILGGSNGPELFMLIPLGITLVMLVSGLYLFRRTERTIVDLL